MKSCVVVFDRAEAGSHGSKLDPNNSPEMLIERREASLQVLGEFCGADKVSFVDDGKGETYVVTKGEKNLTLSVSGNSFDGGYMNISVEEK